MTTAKDILWASALAAACALTPLDASAKKHCSAMTVAWMNGVPGNPYDEAILQGTIDAAEKRNADVTPFYSFFDPSLQLAQCYDIIDSGDYDAIVILPADSTALSDCAAAAQAAGIPLVAADLPMGADPTTAEPQAPGQIGAVLVPPANIRDEFVFTVIDRCAGIDPCEVVFIAGFYGFLNDQLTLEGLQDAAAAHANIELVAVEEGLYSTDIAYSIAADLLANGVMPDIVINGGDQMALGVELAVADAGLPPGSIDIVGGGGGAYAYEAIQDGRWYGTFITLPYDEGYIAARMAIRAALGKKIKDPGINPVEERGLPYMLTSDNINDEFDKFVPQWPQ